MSVIGGAAAARTLSRAVPRCSRSRVIRGLFHPMLTLLECSQDGKLQPVLVAARCFFRPDDVVQGCDLHGNAKHSNQSRGLLPLGVVNYARRLARANEIAEPGDQVTCSRPRQARSE